MNYFDDENIIIEHFQGVECSSVFFVNETDKATSIFESIHDVEEWKQWINSSKKSDPPPDFYCDQFKLMMDVMRVDDHSFINEKNKVVNPTNMKESKIQAEIKESCILKLFPNANRVIVNAQTELTSDEDHNYKFYKENFIRTVRQHKSKIAQYKVNHPNFKVIFFILDESSAYFQAQNDNVYLEVAQNSNVIFKGEPHFHFWDKEFIEELMIDNLDFIIWYTPFKLLRTDEGRFDLPEVCVYDTKGSAIDLKKYNDKMMISSEK